jgi:hypothetical protein
VNKYPGSIKVRISYPGTSMPDWIVTSLKVKSTPERTVEYLNHLAKKKGIHATYTLATQAEYDAARAK